MYRVLLFILILIIGCNNNVNNEQQNDSLDLVNKEVKPSIEEVKKFQLSAPDSSEIIIENSLDTVRYKFTEIVNNIIKNGGETSSAFISDVVTLAIIEDNSYVIVTFDIYDKNLIEKKLGKEQLIKWNFAYNNFYKAFTHANGRLYFGRSTLAKTWHNMAQGFTNFASPDDDLKFVPNDELSKFLIKLPEGIELLN